MTRVMRLFAVIALLAGMPVALAEDKKAFDDAEFVKMAASDGLHEVELGKIGVEKGKHEAVKKFGQKMVDDHTKANQELKSVAKEAGLSVPDKMLEKHEKEVNKFREFKGDNFDAEYVKHQIKDHEMAVAMFTRASKEAKNDKVKAFAAKTLPVLQGHLEIAKKLQEQVKGN